ncbi:MAG: Rpn family recombination-promoting nuclease/putative transposase [Leptospirales bacterium]|nr:Rpn family recombination-promoting nuclease/putative transposase [Leptospirales bacterium]
MKAKRQYKDGLLRSIFNDKSRLLELYNAIEGTSYKDESIIEINTLNDALFTAVKNDISFTVNNEMVILIEHQSTINENMPLRMLSYITRIYEKMTDKRIYNKSVVKIAEPKFIVLYNGKEPYPKEKFLRLSDAFKKTDKNGLISLDLIVRMLNINKGCNPALERGSKTLDGYAIFIEKVREYEKKLPLEEAVKSAVTYCIENGILEDYFRQNLSEVVDMVITLEYNLKDAIEAAREEGMEEGKKEVQSYVLELMAQGLSYEEIKKKIEEVS